MAKNELAPKGGDILIYQTEGGQTKVDDLRIYDMALSTAEIQALYQAGSP